MSTARIREISGWNLSYETGSNESLPKFSSDSPGKMLEKCLKTDHYRLLPHPSPLIIIMSLDSVTGKAQLNK